MTPNRFLLLALVIPAAGLKSKFPSRSARRALALGVVLIMLSTPLAGCLGSDDVAPANAEPEVNTNATALEAPSELLGSDCSEQEALLPLPADRAPPVPEGFEPKPFPGDPMGETVQVAIFTWSCEGGNGTLAGAPAMWVGLAVTPPEEHRSTTVDASYILYFGYTSDPERVGTYAAWGLPVFEHVNVTLDLRAPTPATGAGTAHGAGSELEFSINTTVTGPDAAPGPTTQRFFVLGQQGVVGALDRTLGGRTVRGPGPAVVTSNAPLPPEGEGFHARGFDTMLQPVTGLNLSDTPQPAGNVTNSTDLAPRVVHTGVSGPEPTIGALPTGELFVQNFNTTLRSTDGGATWTPVYNYSFETLTGTWSTQDPMLWVDRANERVYWNHMRPNRAGGVGVAGIYQNTRCTVLGWSEDAGDSWTRNDDACGLPVVDYQKLGGGPPGPDPNPLAGSTHPSVLYLCYQRSAPMYYGSHCAMSYDGGATWPVESRVSGGGLGGGRPTVADDGTVLVPTADGLAVSTDSGLTWSLREGPSSAWVKEVAFSPDGTLYALASRGEIAHIARSPDLGRSWEGPWRVSPPGIGTNAYRAMAVGEGGRVAVAVVGTNHTLDDPVDAPPEARWHLYVTVSEDADTATPSFRSVQATTDPVQVGMLCTRGSCDDTGARNLLDFIDAAEGPNGTFYVAFADGCTGACAMMADPKPEDSRDDEGAVAWLEGWSLREGASP